MNIGTILLILVGILLFGVVYYLENRKKPNNTINNNVAPTDNKRNINNKNTVAEIIKICAFISLIIFLAIGYELADNDYELSKTIFMPYFISGFISCTVLYGFGEIIQLLHNINSKLK